MSLKSELRQLALKEIADPDYANYTHGRKHTNDRGCKGPLCLKAGRDRNRNRFRKKKREAGILVKTVYRPNWRDVFVAELMNQYRRGQLR